MADWVMPSAWAARVKEPWRSMATSMRNTLISSPAARSTPRDLCLNMNFFHDNGRNYEFLLEALMPHIWGRASLGRDSFETLGLPEITSTATMARNPRYDLLFEPLKIGPVTAPNRFYQVPHCTGMGMDQPGSLTRLREIK